MVRIKDTTTNRLIYNLIDYSTCAVSSSQNIYRKAYNNFQQDAKLFKYCGSKNVTYISYFNPCITVAKETIQLSALPMHRPCRSCYEDLPISVDVECVDRFRGQSFMRELLVCAPSQHRLLVTVATLPLTLQTMKHR